MRKKNRQKNRNLQEVSALVAELESSGLSAIELAKREGVSVGAVYQWKKKAGRRCAQPVEPIELVTPSNHGILAPLTTAGICLEIGEIKCSVEPDFDQQTLVRVIEAIQSKKQHSC